MAKKLRTGRPTKVSQVNSRMQKEGRWEEFSTRRIQLRRDGVPDHVAWRVICNLMPPLDGSPPEARVTADIQPIITKYIDNLPEIPEQPALGARQGYFDIQAGLAKKFETESNNQFVGDLKKANLDWHSEWQLIAQRVPIERVAMEVDIVRWVFNNAGTPPDRLNPDDVPSLGGLKYLEHVQSSPIHYAEFVRTNWSKMLPDKKQLEYESRFADDGKRSTKLLDEFLSTLTGDKEVPSNERTGTGDDRRDSQGTPVEV